jgi:hypothetical protein
VTEATVVELKTRTEVDSMAVAVTADGARILTN